MAAAPPVTPTTAAAKSAGAGGAFRSVLLDLLIVVCVLIAGLICALAVTGVRRRVRSARAAEATWAGRGRGPARHSRDQPPPPPAIQPPRGVGWSRTPPRHAIVAGSVWDSANPSSRPNATRPADGPLPPWEQSPAVFASAPVPKAPPPWPLSSSGPMYVWNPDATTTGPLNIADRPPPTPPEVDR